MLEFMTIRFPNLGIELQNVGTGIDVFGFKIAYYGIIMAIAMLVGYLVAEWQAKRTGQDKELYLDFTIYAIFFSIIGARVYYVVFAWDEYKNNILSVFNIRGGGLAIYGGIIAAVLTAIIYCKIKKYSFWLLADTGCIGLITGQIIGRWGNFFNREAFGDYTNNLFAMQIQKSDVALGTVTQKMLDNIVVINGIEFIQVHPTFLYESLWNIGLLVLLILYTKHKKFDGEIIMLYFVGYGIGRTWIEGLRTDQLLLWGTNLAASQLLSILLIVVASAWIVYKRIQISKK